MHCEQHRETTYTVQWRSAYRYRTWKRGSEDREYIVQWDESTRGQHGRQPEQRPDRQLQHTGRRWHQRPTRWTQYRRRGGDDGGVERSFVEGETGVQTLRHDQPPPLPHPLSPPPPPPLDSQLRHTTPPPDRMPGLTGQRIRHRRRRPTPSSTPLGLRWTKIELEEVRIPKSATDLSGDKIYFCEVIKISKFQIYYFKKIFFWQ